MLNKILRRFMHKEPVIYDGTFFGGQWFREWEALRKVLFALIRREPLWRSILDFGCGPGVMIDFMNDRGYRYVGCDSSAEARTLYLTHFGRYPEKYFSRLKDTAMQRFDLLLSFDVFEHMPDENIAMLLSETRNIPEVLVNISRERGIPGHINIKPDARWVEFFAACGFEHVSAKTRELREAYEILRPGCPDLWNKNLFLFRRSMVVAETV